MLQHGYEMDFTTQNFGVIIYGAPGIGKTTVALSDGKSGGDTLLIDLERGVGRTQPVHRMNATVLTADNYEEVLADIQSPEAAAVKNIVIDTCGALVDYIKDWVMRTRPDARTKAGTFNGLKGFGYVKSEIESFTGRIKNAMHKNIIYIFHCDEKADKDGNPIQRLRCEGSFRNTVWTGIDFGCYVQMIGNQRVACFTPEQEFFAKGCHGIDGHIPIPELKPGTDNLFVKRLFEVARANMQAEQDALAPMMEEYNAVMNKVREIINGITDAESAGKAAQEIPNMQHVLTSKSEASAMLRDKTLSLGLKWDSAAKAYVQAGDGK